MTPTWTTSPSWSRPILTSKRQRQQGHPAPEPATNKKGKKKIVTNPEDDEKNKLHIPENATTLAEWKEKNQRKGPQYKEIKVEVNLERVSKPKDETIQVQSKKPTGEKKKKTKAVDSKEVELNKLVNLKLEDDSQRNYQGKHYTKSKQNKGFKFDKEEFPSLS